MLGFRKRLRFYGGDKQASTVRKHKVATAAGIIGVVAVLGAGRRFCFHQNRGVRVAERRCNLVSAINAGFRLGKGCRCGREMRKEFFFFAASANMRVAVAADISPNGLVVNVSRFG